MRFTWFNLMPWPYLPDDFRQQNRSVWVDIPGRLYDPRKGHFVYHEYMDQLEYADALGFDGIGVNEHHQNGSGPTPSPNNNPPRPAPPPPPPPLYIPGGGSVETWDFCADFDYNYSYLSFTGYVRGKQFLDGFWERVAAKGKDPSPYRAAFAQIICVADTDREAEELYSEHVRYFFNRCLHVYPGFADPPGYRTIKTLKVGALAQLTEDALAKFPTLTWKQLVDDRYVIAGSPETVRQQMEEMIQGLRIGHVFCLFHNGNMPDWKTRHSSKLFAEQVMPKLRHLWPEWRDDDRWWPKPMADRREPERSLPGAEARQ